jgi:1-acyl-sn-glycerol-3-phosphate acyltransferase
VDPLYRMVVRTVLSAFALKRWTLEVSGHEHVPESGGAIIATNHIGYIDFMVSGYAVKRATRANRLVRYAAKKEVFDHPVSGPLMRGMKHIPVDRGGAAEQTIEVGVDYLQRGELVGMFPEATISRSFVPLPGKTGTARMAQLAGVPIVPAAIWGSQRIWTKGRPRDLSSGVLLTVDFGEPMEVGPDQDVEAATLELMGRIGRLVDTAQRRYPVNPAQGEEWWVPAHLGGTAPTPEEAAAQAATEAAERRRRRAAERGESSPDETPG